MGVGGGITFLRFPGLPYTVGGTQVITYGNFTFYPLPWGVGGLNSLVFNTSGCGSNCVLDVLLSTSPSPYDTKAQVRVDFDPRFYFDARGLGRVGNGWGWGRRKYPPPPSQTTSFPPKVERTWLFHQCSSFVSCGDLDFNDFGTACLCSLNANTF